MGRRHWRYSTLPTELLARRARQDRLVRRERKARQVQLGLRAHKGRRAPLPCHSTGPRTAARTGSSTSSIRPRRIPLWAGTVHQQPRAAVAVMELAGMAELPTGALADRASTRSAELAPFRVIPAGLASMPRAAPPTTPSALGATV